MIGSTDADFRAVFKECLAELHSVREPTFKHGFIKYAVLLALAALDSNDAAVQQALECLIALRNVCRYWLDALRWRGDGRGVGGYGGGEAVWNTKYCPCVVG